MRAILITLALFFLSGCTTLKPSIAEYNITIEDLDIAKSESGCKERSLKIAKAFSSTSLASLRMDYTEFGNRVFAYSQSQWQESPKSIITSQLLKNIRESELFKSVHSSNSRVKSDLILETNIEEFMQFYTQNLQESYVKVVLSSSLIDVKTNSVVAIKTFNSKVDTKTLDASGGVEAFESALSKIISQNIEWLNGVCR